MSFDQVQHSYINVSVGDVVLLVCSTIAATHATNAVFIILEIQDINFYCLFYFGLTVGFDARK